MALALVLSGAPGLSRGADHPWATFFADRPADVADGTRQEVTLPGPVAVSRERSGGQWSYVGVDLSDHGAVGCVALILSDLQAVLEQCDGPFPDITRNTIAEALAQIAEFYARHAVPPVSSEAFHAAARQRPVPGTCGPALYDNVAPFLEWMTSPEAMADLRHSLAVPRLPVTNPCL